MPGQASTSCNLLVLGGAGFLGRHVTRRALVQMAPEEGTVSIASRDPQAAIHESLLPRTVNTYEVEAARGEHVERLLDELRPTHIVNCIALPSIGRCAADPELASKLNAELPGRLARWTSAHGARLVHVSTDLVFGGEREAGRAYREDDLPAPLNEYGRTKAAGETAVLGADPAALVVRVPLLFGDSHGTGRGASDALLAELEAGRKPTLFTDEWRSPLDVGNAAEALLDFTTRTEVRGILHVAGPDALTRYDLGLLVLLARGLSKATATSLVTPSTRNAAGGAGAIEDRPRNVCLDASEARRILSTRLDGATEALAADRPASPRDAAT